MQTAISDYNHLVHARVLRQIQKFMCYCTVLPRFILNLRAISKYKLPRAYIRRVDLTEGFLRYEFRGAYTWRGLFSKFYCIYLCNQLRILQTFTEKDTNNLNNSSRIKSVYLEDKAQLAYPITVQMRIRKYYQLVITLRAEVRGTQRLFPPFENTF